MNVFLLDYDPIKAAHHLDDKRVPKMILEAGQQLSTAIKMKGGVGNAPPGLYRITHANSGSNVWVRHCTANFWWTWWWMMALGDVYKDAFGKRHASMSIVDILGEHADYVYTLFPEPVSKDIGGYITRLDSCRNSTYNLDFSNYSDDAVLNYRMYIYHRWFGTDKSLPTWRGRGEPSWLDDIEERVVREGW